MSTGREVTPGRTILIAGEDTNGVTRVIGADTIRDNLSTESAGGILLLVGEDTNGVSRVVAVDTEGKLLVTG